MIRRLLLGALVCALAWPASAQSVDVPAAPFNGGTITGALTASAAGAASTPGLTVSGEAYTGGSGTTNFPQFYYNCTGSTGPTTLSTAGTVFGINTCTGFAGKLADFRVNGGDALFSISSTGAVSSAASVSGTRLVVNGSTIATNGLYLPSANTLGFAANSTQTMTMTSTAVTIPTQTFALSAIASDVGQTDTSVCQDTTAHKFYAGSGTLGVCLGTSSMRFKHDIKPLEAGLKEIMGLKAQSFRMNQGYGNPEKTMYGFLAEDAVSVLPGLVGLDGSGKPLSVDYLGMIPILVQAMQEQQAQIDELRATVNDLRGRVKTNAANDNGPGIDPNLWAHMPGPSPELLRGVREQWSVPPIPVSVKR